MHNKYCSSRVYTEDKEFNCVINDIVGGLKGTLSSSVDYTNLSIAVYTLEGRAVIQKDLDRIK